MCLCLYEIFLIPCPMVLAYQRLPVKPHYWRQYQQVVLPKGVICSPFYKYSAPQAY